MAVDLKEKLKAFGIKPSAASAFGPSKTEGVILPQAFLTVTKKANGMIPAGVQVIAERNVTGQFRCTWWDADDRPIDQVYGPDDFDYSQVLQDSLADMLAKISTEDLRAEIGRRHTVETEGKKKNA